MTSLELASLRKVGSSLALSPLTEEATGPTEDKGGRSSPDDKLPDSRSVPAPFTGQLLLEAFPGHLAFQFCLPRPLLCWPICSAAFPLRAPSPAVGIQEAAEGGIHNSGRCPKMEGAAKEQ